MADYKQNNIQGTKNLLLACKNSNIKNFIFLSSCSVYGSIKGSVSERKKLNPQGYYAYTKFVGEELVKKFKDLTSTGIKTMNDLSGCSIYIKNITESSSRQQKNFLNFLETDLSQPFLNNPQFKKPRIFVSTKSNIFNDVEKGLFREDLYYRLNVVPIKMPPLRDKFEDIPDLASHFLNK